MFTSALTFCHVYMKFNFRGIKVTGYEEGNFLGPTILAGETRPGIPAYDEEVFGPVLCCVGVDTLEEAIALVNSCQYGNGELLYP